MSVHPDGRYGTAAAIRSRAVAATPWGGRRPLRPGATAKPLAALSAGEFAAPDNKSRRHAVDHHIPRVHAEI